MDDFTAIFNFPLGHALIIQNQYDAAGLDNLKLMKSLGGMISCVETIGRILSNDSILNDIANAYLRGIQIECPLKKITLDS
ncbi:MAG: hypothetical protein GWN14_27235, partial [candidate division Zixibacteria bacterium]|nr:hypothetical protein [candidate division Zixibacteria bacterium]